MPSNLTAAIIVSVLAFLGAGCLPREAAQKLPTENMKSLRAPEVAPLGDLLVIPGRFADPDVLQIAEDEWWMYFGVEPEAPNHSFDIYTATSENGTSWKLHKEPILSFATFPDVVRLPDGRLRLYFQQAQEIQSAISSDGLNFQMENGVRLRQTGALDDEGVAAPSVVQKPDGAWLMVFRATAKGRHQPTSINLVTTTLITAESLDGLSWIRGETVVDSRNDTFDGYVDGPELFYDPDGLLHLRFWSPGKPSESSNTSGQYDMTSLDDGLTWSEPLKFNDDILGGDPTYTFINETLFMYYTVLTEGIVLRQPPS
jgi:hypothetical protein